MSDETRDFALPDEVYDFLEETAVEKGVTLEDLLVTVLTSYALKHGLQMGDGSGTKTAPEPPSYSKGTGLVWKKPSDKAPLHKHVLHFLYTNRGESFTRMQIHAAVAQNKKPVSVGTAIYKLRDEGNIRRYDTAIVAHARRVNFIIPEITLAGSQMYKN